MVALRTILHRTTFAILLLGSSLHCFAGPAEARSKSPIQSDESSGHFDLGIAAKWVTSPNVLNHSPVSLNAGYWGTDQLPISVRLEGALWGADTWYSQLDFGWAFMHSRALKQFIGIGVGTGGVYQGTSAYCGPAYGLAWHLLYFQAGYYFYNSAPSLSNAMGLLGLRFEL